MKKTAAALGVLMGALVALGPMATAQEAAQASAVDLRLIAFAAKMRVSLSMAAFAAFSPSLPDARAQADRLATLLRGDGDKTLGLVQEADLLPEWIATRVEDPDKERAMLTAAESVRGFLRLALSSALSASRARTLAVAADDLLRAYACLLAAWGQPVEGVSIPGLVAVLRGFNIPVAT